MSAILVFLQSLLSAVGKAAAWLGRQMLFMLEGLWRAFLVLVDQLLAFLLQIVDFVIGGVVEVLLFVLGILVALLPAMPASPNSAGFISDALGIANRYLPVQEALTLGLIWATIYGGLYIYKGAKFLRGGG